MTMFRVFLGAPSKGDISKNPSSYNWQNVASTSTSSNASTFQPFPPATLEAASRKISQFYRNIIFDDDDDDDDDADDESPSGDDATAITWDDSLVSEADYTDPPAEYSKSGLISREETFATTTQGGTQETSAFYSDTSSIGRFPTFTFNLHTLLPISNLSRLANYTKVNVLAAVLELEGPDVIHIKKGPDAGKEVSILKLVLGDEGSVCKLTVWRETAEEWALTIKRGDIAHFETLSVSKDPSIVPGSSNANLTASPNTKSRLQICFRSMPSTSDDSRLRPDLRLGYSDVAVRKVAAVVAWFEAMAGLHD